MLDARKDDVISVAAKGRPRRGRVTQVGKAGTSFAGFAEITFPEGKPVWRMITGLTLVRRPVPKAVPNESEQNRTEGSRS